MTGDTAQGGPPPRHSAEERRGNVRIIGADRAGGAERAASGAPGLGDAEETTGHGNSEDAGPAAEREGGADGSGFGPEDWADLAAADEPLLPHWTEAPTGEVPAVLSRGGQGIDDDPWAALPEPSWREGHADWAQAESIAPALSGEDAERSRFLTEPDTTERQPWSFELGDDETSGLDDDFEDEHDAGSFAAPRAYDTGRRDAAYRSHDNPRSYEDLEDLDAGELFGASAAERAGGAGHDSPESIAGEKTSILRLTAIAAAAAAGARDEAEQDRPGEIGDREEAGSLEAARRGRTALDTDDAWGSAAGEQRGATSHGTLEDRAFDDRALDDRVLDDGVLSTSDDGTSDDGTSDDGTVDDGTVDGADDPEAAPDEITGARHRRTGLRSSVGRRGAPRRPHVEPAARGARLTPPGARAALPATGTLRRGEDAVSKRTGRNITAAIVSGVVIGALALIAFDFGTVPSMVVVTAVLTLAAMEGFGAFRRAGYRPATLLGLVAVVGLLVATYNKTTEALPAVLVLLVAATFFWHLVGVDRRAEPVRSISATLLVFCWVGVFGSFAALLLAPSLFPHRTGIAYLLGALIAAVAYDVGALAAGAWVGKHPLSAVSPGKTWEGVIGGAVVAIAVSVGVVHLIHPWSLKEAAVLGVIVAIVSPIGDLCESLVKRHLGLKDMGRILPGHGGLLDRVDGLLFVLPATYYLVRAFH